MKSALLRMISFCLLLLFSTTLSAQNEDEPLIEQLREQFKKKYLSIGFVFQGVLDLQQERTQSGNNGFNISNMRVTISGDLDKNFSYLVRTNFINSPALLDAKMGLKVSDALKMNLGLFKSPFSKEYLTAADAIDFVNRSQVVSALAPNRQIGFQISGATTNSVFNYSGGIFNGNRFAQNNNDNNKFMAVGRVSVLPLASGDSGTRLEIGLNGGVSQDDSVSIAGYSFTGDRSLLGVDARIESARFLLAGEYIYADLEEIKPSGFHATAGFKPAEDHQLLLRYDSFRRDENAESSEFFIAGWNFWPSQVTELQVNYVIDINDSNFEHNQLLINAQLAF